MKSTLTYCTALAGLIAACVLNTSAVAENDFKVLTKNGLSITNNDDSVSIQLGGRLQWDYDRTEVDHTDIVSEKFEIRRARLFVKGKINDWGFKTQFNFAEAAGKSNGTVAAFYVTYSGWGEMAKITIGNHDEPFGLEQLTSSKDISILERSAATETFTPSRNAGVKISGSRKKLHLCDRTLSRGA